MLKKERWPLLDAETCTCSSASPRRLQGPFSCRSPPAASTPPDWLFRAANRGRPTSTTEPRPLFASETTALVLRRGQSVARPAPGACVRVAAVSCCCGRGGWRACRCVADSCLYLTPPSPSPWLSPSLRSLCFLLCLPCSFVASFRVQGHSLLWLPSFASVSIE